MAERDPIPLSDEDRRRGRTTILPMVAAALAGGKVSARSSARNDLAGSRRCSAVP